MKWFEVTKSDLHWWKQLSKQVVWTEAKTYRNKAPHHYIVAGKTPGIGWDETQRIAALIYRFGIPQKYYEHVNLYLEDEEQGVKWWAMDFWADQTNLINMAPIDQHYGVQDAPVTYSGLDTFYDRIGLNFDRRFPQGTPREREAIKLIVREAFYDSSPRTLDVGAGIGTTLDMNLCSPKSCTAVDPSQHLLNINVKRNNTLHRTLPKTLKDAEQNLLGKYDLTLATFGTGSLLSAEEVDIMMQHTRRLGVVMLWPEGVVPDHYSVHIDEAEKMRTFANEQREKIREVLKEHGGETGHIGRYETWVVER